MFCSRSSESGFSPERFLLPAVRFDCVGQLEFHRDTVKREPAGQLIVLFLVLR